MAKYDRLKKCKAQGCPLSVDAVTSSDGNGVCYFHDLAKSGDWMVTRDRIIEHQDFLVMVQKIRRLDVRYKPMSHELIDAWIARVNKGVKAYVLCTGDGAKGDYALQALKHLLNANHI